MPNAHSTRHGAAGGRRYSMVSEYRQDLQYFFTSPTPLSSLPNSIWPDAMVEWVERTSLVLGDRMIWASRVRTLFETIHLKIIFKIDTCRFLPSQTLGIIMIWQRIMRLSGISGLGVGSPVFKLGSTMKLHNVTCRYPFWYDLRCC